MEFLEHIKQHMSVLVGGTITGIVTSTDDTGDFGLRVSCVNGTDNIVWFGADPEWNGPGWFDIQPFELNEAPV